ncbi:MAG: hypothetical protein WKF31_08015 [Thermoleophilaceae bacterium]
MFGTRVERWPPSRPLPWSSLERPTCGRRRPCARVVTVRNVTARAPCATDGACYTIRGTWGPRSGERRRGRATTLYLHGLAFGQFLSVIPGAGHAIGLDGSAPRFRAAVGRWVDRHGFSARGR